ncbi:hypothetical protein GTP91_00305 [Rugamonas sp. FT82W]|uniref:Uncharacterized protein n=2 Tax=Duganella vulcania TaxID=2692166 RepID=A0A845FYG6_9BURK|nr:hypothetical protein [Duganella vulcania]MYM85616.1 hypothetical protein [Duganella vulcania]
MSSNRAAEDGGKRILAHLEHGPKTAAKAPRASGWTIDGWTVGLGLLVVTMCTVAWLVHDNTLSTDSYARSRSSVATRAYQQPTERQMVAAAPAEQAAAIVNEPALKEPASKSLAAMETHAPTGVAPPPAPAVAKAETSHAAGAPHRPAVASNTAAMRSPAPRAIGAGIPPAIGDTDVALLTALVAHSGKPALALPERSRDVVERQDGDSTAQLLARCKQLGLIEGMLCRSRICSGRWDADLACNAPSH